MPIYEYACPGCGSRFEKIVRRFGEPVSCPACARADVEKQLSVFAVSTSAASPVAGCGAGSCRDAGGECPPGPCGGGACSLN